PGSGHDAPAPSDVCSCGLHAYHDPQSAAGGDVWGAVLAWGKIEVHADGLRSQWQRPLVIAPRAGIQKHKLEQIPHVAERYGVHSAVSYQVEGVARQYGSTIPIELIPIAPLAILATEWQGWQPFRVSGILLSNRISELVPPGRQGSPQASRKLAGCAVDLATSAAFQRARTREDPELLLVEIALTGVLIA